ncbi:MAG TPA: hypothetical protein VFM88_03770 [Vicinamibacteria bacterium]|nr:hypothetical protein [Vicinamibacteria bacterium]
MPDELSVYQVPDDAPAKTEAMGTKPKFWFSRDEAMWLFKATRPGQGENWAEVVAAGLAQMLGLPHAHYELARWRDSTGIVTPRFTPDGFDLVHGNELLAERDPNYPRAGARYVRTREHTIDTVRAVIADQRVGLPIGWAPPASIETAADVFGGYLLLDAWIANTDRHHENWGLVVNIGRDERHLAPTFDHASSLGAHEPDNQRAKRLESPDPAFRVEGYVQRPRVRSALYGAAGDARPLGLIEAFKAWAAHARCNAWLERLASVRENAVSELLDRLPSLDVSGPARAFAQAILAVNRRRILEAR